MKSRCLGRFPPLLVALALARLIPLVATASAPASAAAEAMAKPRILSIERVAGDLLIRASAPEGVARIVLETCRRQDLAGWRPLALLRVTPSVTEATFRVPASERLEMFRVRADASDPLPASFYLGTTNFPGEPAPGGPGGPFRADDSNAPGAGAGAEQSPRDVVESDIWAVQGDRLYFFNQLRGLQVIDISETDAPVVLGTFPLPGMGEQMYLLEDRYAVLLAYDPCQAWGIDAASAVILVDTQAQPPAEVARFPIEGRMIESRLVGTALYVATETWKESADGSGAWVSGTWVSSFDLSEPASPKAREPLWFPGSGNVVTATDRFLFVAVTDYSQSWPWRSDLQVVDITAPDGSLNAFTKISLPGRVADKFKIDLLDDVLRVVVEATESANSSRWVTVLRTYRLSDPRAVPPFAYVELDKLELARGDRLFATRFDGTRGYIVTFQRVDPLWVIDLSDPANLRIAGQLEIPGWSTYIRPMGDRLLTLGVDDSRGSRVAVQLFDVADPAHPALLAKAPLGNDYSWSEASQDEKAFGVFPDARLLLVPLSDWNGDGSRTGVQLIDFGRDTLTERGFLSEPDLVPRRAVFHNDRVIAISGRRLTVADVTDRDQPVPSATLELAYPVERILVDGLNLLEFAGTSLRIRAAGAESSTATAVDLGSQPVIGASLRAGRLQLLQGSAATVTWDQDPSTGEWIGHTNAGTLVASTWDASSLPQLTKVGEDKTETDQTWLSDRDAFWMRDDLLVWAGPNTTSVPWWGWRGPLVDVAIPSGDAAVVPGFWIPWWYGGPPELMAVAVPTGGKPRILSQTRLGTRDDSAGESFAEGPLVYSARQRQESEVVGTNVVVETVWIPGGSEPGTDPPGPDADGSKGDWQRVTNSYPVLQWWTRYDLDVVDYSVDAARPMVRPPVSLPGALRGIGRQGALLYTTSTREAAGETSTGQPTLAWLEASAYDGIEVHLVDSTAIADLTAGETYAVTVLDDLVYVARGGWNVGADNRLELWTVADNGRWHAGNRVQLSSAPGELRRFDDLLLARNGGTLDLFGIQQPTQPQALPTSPLPGCYGGNLDRADGDSNRGLWLPLGELGAVRVGP